MRDNVYVAPRYRAAQVLAMSQELAETPCVSVR